MALYVRNINLIDMFTKIILLIQSNLCITTTLGTLNSYRYWQMVVVQWSLMLKKFQLGPLNDSRYIQVVVNSGLTILCYVNKWDLIREMAEEEGSIHYGKQLMPSVVFLTKKMVTRACLFTKMNFLLFYELQQLTIS